MQEFNQNHYQHLPGGSAAGFGGGAPLKRPKPFLAPLTVPPGHVCFRLLCHVSRVGGIIGKSGAVIRQLQQDTSAKIRVEDPSNGSDDHRVIVIIGWAVINRRLNLNAAAREAGGGDGEEVAEVSSAQEAVVRVFERVIEVAAESGVAAIAGGGLASCRLLANAVQVGSVIGKGGKVVEKMRKDTGCRIKVLKSDKFPTDEMVEIEGDIMAIKKALIAVTHCLQDNFPIADRVRMTPALPQEALPGDHLRMMPVPQTVETTSFREADRVPLMEPKPPQCEVSFKILCLNDRVGSVIGKGGSIVRGLQAESNAMISIGPIIPDCEERVITITSFENVDSQESPAQNAVMLVFGCIAESGSQQRLDLGKDASPVSARLVVQINQVGCLLGKGGTIISEMRKTTGTFIKIFAGDQVPSCVLNNDEVVQINGELGNVRAALYQVTGRLRSNLLSTRVPNSVGHGVFGSGRDQPLPGFLPPTNVPDNFNKQNILSRSMNNLSLSESANHVPPARPWRSQGVPGVGHQRNPVDDGGATSVKGGVELGSGSRTAIVTNTTVEIMVPENVIASVYGENGSNLVRLRQISGAKVLVHEPLNGATDRMVVISGTPDETHAAQSLLHAFLLTGSS